MTNAEPSGTSGACRKPHCLAQPCWAAAPGHGDVYKRQDIDDGEIILKGMHISPYEQGNIFNKDPRRPRRLLAHKSEIRHLQQQIKLQGYTLVPLQLYFKQGRVKVELGLCKGKKLYDKRADAAARDAKRDIDRAIKTRR